MTMGSFCCCPYPSPTSAHGTVCSRLCSVCCTICFRLCLVEPHPISLPVLMLFVTISFNLYILLHHLLSVRSPRFNISTTHGCVCMHTYPICTLCRCRCHCWHPGGSVLSCAPPGSKTHQTVLLISNNNGNACIHCLQVHVSLLAPWRQCPQLYPPWQPTPSFCADNHTLKQNACMYCTCSAGAGAMAGTLAAVPSAVRPLAAVQI